MGIVIEVAPSVLRLYDSNRVFYRVL